MKFKTISINKLSWKSSMMKAPKLEKIYNSVGFINQRSTYQYTTNQKETVVFFCMEKRDNLITFIELNKKIKYGPQPLIYFPYSHLSSLPLNFKDSCILFKEISQYLINTNNKIVIAPFYYHKPYTLETTEEPLIHFYDSQGEIEEALNLEKRNPFKDNVYLDDITSPKEALNGSYFKGSVAVQLESIIETKYRELLLSTLNYVRVVESPLLYNYEGKLASHYLKKFPARQFYLKTNNNEYFLRIASCHGVFSKLGQIKDLKVPIGYYEKALCFRKEQVGQIKKGERCSSFIMPDCHLVVPIEDSEKYFNKANELLTFFFHSILQIDYKKVLRTTGTIKDTSFWDQIDSINNTNYFCEKSEFEVKGIQLGTVQIDYENPRIYFKDKTYSIIHFAPGSLQRICSLISSDKRKLLKLVPCYKIYILEKEDSMIKPSRYVIIIKDKTVLSKILSSITDAIYSIIVIGDLERESDKVKKSLRLRDKKGSLLVEELSLNEVNRNRTDIFSSQS